MVEVMEEAGEEGIVDDAAVADDDDSDDDDEDDDDGRGLLSKPHSAQVQTPLLGAVRQPGEGKL